MIKDLNESTVIVQSAYSPIDSATCATTYNANDTYTAFIGGVEVPVAKLSELVPVTFMNSTKPVMVNEEETLVQKTWGEYCLNVVNESNTKALLHYLHIFPNGNRIILDSDAEGIEWRNWYAEFGDQLLTKSIFQTKRISIEYTPIAL